MIVELRAVPGCPNLDATRAVLQASLAEAGLSVAVVERIGEYPSPSVLVDGRDVTGADSSGPAACVLRPPTAEQIRAALRAVGRPDARQAPARVRQAVMGVIGAAASDVDCFLPDPVPMEGPAR